LLTSTSAPPMRGTAGQGGLRRGHIGNVTRSEVRVAQARRQRLACRGIKSRSP
jgi:hypothetical protein